jgi:diacylglycerol kinase (ATP)
MPTYRLILNPKAGRGSGARARASIERFLSQAGVAFELSETQGPGEAARLARDAALSGCDVIVAVGGDGTTHEVVGGLVLAAQERGDWAGGGPVGTLGLIPLGTGNDFGWRLGVPQNDPEAACRLLLADYRRIVDLATVTDELGRTEIFHNHFGAGFEAAAAIESLKIQRLHGLALYMAALSRVIPQYNKPIPVTVRYNGGDQTRPWLLISAANGGRTGGGFKIAPEARLDDGELDLILAHSPTIPRILRLIPHFMRGTHVSQTKYVIMDRTAHLVLEAPEGIPVHLDGEVYRTDARRLEVTVLPRRLRVIADPAVS